MTLSPAAPQFSGVLNEYLPWWRTQMRALLDAVVPARWRSAGEPARILHLDPHGHIHGLEDPAPQGQTPTLLDLPPGTMLARDISLPLAVGRDLTSAVRFEMDRLTPFSADELYWDVRPLRRDTTRGQLTARLALVPRATLAPALATLDASGITPHALTSGPDRITLAGGLAHGTARRRRIAWLAGACAVCALLAAATPFIRLAREENAVQTQISALQPNADAAQRLRNQLARRSTATAALARAQQTTGDALAALAAVTRALPDDTHLTSFTLHQRHLSFDGQSAAAARLIGRIAADPALREPSFGAPVTSTGTGDLFSIHATLAPPGASRTAGPTP